METLLLGCNRSPATGKVSGVVTYRGSPLAHADVRFIPDPIGPRGAIAKTDDQGHYELMYDADVAGVIPGTYKVVISTRGSATASKPQADDATTAADPYAANPSSEAMVGGTEMLPMKYCSSKETILTATVEQGANTIAFDLE